MNKNIWNLYRNSERAKEAIALFKFDVTNDSLEKKVIEISRKFKEYLGGKNAERNFYINCALVMNSIQVEKLFQKDSESRTKYFIRLIDTLEIVYVKQDPAGKLIKVESKKPIICKKNYKALCSILPEISFILYLTNDFSYFPIFFREQFDVFIKTLDILGIEIPEFPAKPDKRGRLLLYDELNRNIIQFAEENDLTREETCACIYDFASLLLEEDEKQIQLPDPTNIWLTGGSEDDYKTLLKNPIEGVKSVWTCNENTKRGDIIIMYVLSPYSCIQSIWRADIDGVYTPFNYYNSRTRVINGMVIPQITLNELKSDKYFSQLPITRKNFQGVNGIQFSATDYDELQRLIKLKGYDVSVLPQLYKPNLEIDAHINNENDVEEKLLIPLLDKLGYSRTDWTRQLTQKAGRNEKAIPDFVFLPKGEKHFQNAPLVIEAKFDITSNIERTKSYNQALSYARLMKSLIFGICDKNRLMIFKAKNGHFDRFNPTFEKHWESINNTEVFRQLNLLIGKETIRRSKSK